MENNFSFKELTDVKLKTLHPITIMGRDFEAGEAIAVFDKIQIANFDEIKKTVAAKGGFDNRSHVIWEDTKEVDFYFTQGIFSQMQFALLSNSRMLRYGENSEVKISEREKKESDENGQIKLKQTPDGKVFIYKTGTMEKITDFEITGNIITLKEKYLDVIIDYTFLYTNGGTNLVLGQRLIEGWLSLEGRTRTQDDVTGKVRSGIFRIPKLKMTSELFITVGKNANPVNANFKAVGYPEGDKWNKKVMEISFLNDDLDSDIE